MQISTQTDNQDLRKNETQHSRMDQIKFVEDNFYNIWKGMACFKQTIPLQIF